jgi:hypothetical protein
MAKFTSEYTDHELVDVVREVTLHVNPRRPRDVSLRAFDAAREAAGHPRAPRASRICERLDMSWPEVKALAHDPARSVGQTLAKRSGAEELGAHCSVEDAVRCVRSIAQRLGVDALDPASYDRECETVRAENRRRWRHGRELVFPTANQIEWIVGSFAAAAAQAGLAAKQPARDCGVAIVDALDLLVEEFGCVLPYKGLRAFARAKEFRLAREAPGGMRAAIEVLRVRRGLEGKSTPTEYPPPGERPDFDEVAKTAGLPPARKTRWSWDECVEALVRLMDENPGVSLRVRSYRELRAGRRAFPPAGCFSKAGKPGFVAARTEAIRRRRERQTRSSGQS